MSDRLMVAHVEDLVDELTKKLQPVIQDAIAAAAQTSKQTNQGYWARAQSAEYLGITLPTLDMLIRSGQLRAFRIGRNVRLRKDDLDRSLMQVKTS